MAPLDDMVECQDKARHTVLLIKLQRWYLTYCFVCSLLACAAFGSTLLSVVRLHLEGKVHPRHGLPLLEEATMGGGWEALCWILVGFAMIAEMVSQVLVRGFSCFVRDWWCIFDTLVLALTVGAWTLTLMRRLSVAQEEAVEESDLPLLALRFLLQPCRVVVTASMACQVQDMQQSDMDIDFTDVAGESDLVESGCAGGFEEEGKAQGAFPTELSTCEVSKPKSGFRDCCSRRNRPARQCMRRLTSRGNGSRALLWFRRGDNTLGLRKKGYTV